MRDEIQEGRRARRVCLTSRSSAFAGPQRRCFGSSSEQKSSTSSQTTVTDQRVGVSDQGVAASGGATVDQSRNDNRTFDDHSTFTSTTTATDSHNDNRNFDDHSQFTSVTQDNRDFSDHSSFTDSSSHTTNITTLDPEVAKASVAASGAAAAAAAKASTDLGNSAFSTVEHLSTDSTKLFDSALNYGTATQGKAYETVNAITQQGFGFGAKALDSAGTSTGKAFDFAGTIGGTAADLIIKALNTVAAGATADRAFASDTASKIFDTAKSADQQNVEKIIKYGSYVAGGVLVAWVAKSIWGKR